MKTRNGFVTNSSSSSFVIVLQGSTSEDVIKNREDLDKYFLSEYAYGEKLTIEKLLQGEGKWLQKKYNEILNVIEDGKQLYIGRISNDNYYEDLERAITALGFKFKWEEM